MKVNLILEIKWYANDRGGDRRGITIDYTDSKDLAIKKSEILHNFRTEPMDVDYINNGRNIGKIPYSVRFV